MAEVRAEMCPDEGRAIRSSPLRRQAHRFGRRHSQSPTKFPCCAPQRDGKFPKTTGNPANVGWNALAGQDVASSWRVAMDLARWLQQLGLEQYESAFRANAIDDAVLPKLTADDLKDLGVALVGHRRKLLDAIARLPAGLEPAQPKVPIMPTGAERRHLTVMFCDLVGSTALSGYLDPEDLRQLLGAYHATVKAETERFGGFIAKYMGDGVLIYFGYPQAHEDDAERAIRAGLALLERVSHIDSGPEKLSVRIGIATGLVVVGDLIGTGEAQERGIVGETPNVAARLQALAEPNTVLIGAITRSLVGDLFEYRDLGAIKLRGVSEPVPVWQVLRPSAVESRFDALHTRALLPLVGRDEEINLILRRWGRAKAGEGQVVLISGEAGVGKSRIVAAFTERLHGELHHRLRYFCSPYYQASALHPFIEHLGRAAGFAPDDPAASRLEKLNAVLVRAMPPETDLAFIADLLSLPAIIPDQLPNLSAQQKKNRTLQALLGQLNGLARRQPTVIFFEDAHWADPTSCELLDLMVERIGSLPVMLIVTFRPEFRAPWIGHPHVSMLALNRLSRRDRIAMIIQVTGGKALPRNIVDQIADRTDGVPLFIEELTKSVLESGLLRETQDGVYAFDAALPALAIPTTLHALLLERLDRLASVRRVAQIGAAIGREFSYSMLRAIAPLPEQELKADLERLVGSELVFQRGEPPDAMYIFKHALVQDAAHSSLLRSTRQQLHARIAEALEAHFPELMDSQPELFAQHYAEAGLVQQSVASWAKAGRRSVGRSSMAEAAAQFQKSLDQLVLLPDGRERQKQELELRAALGAVLQAVKGLAAPETSHAYDRAYELWEKLDCPSEFLQVPFGRALHHLMRCEFGRALSLADNLLYLSFQHNDTAGTILGHLSCGRVPPEYGQNCTVPSASGRCTGSLRSSPAQLDCLSNRSAPACECTGHSGLGLVLFGIP